MHFKPSVLFQNNPGITMSEICIHGFLLSIKQNQGIESVATNQKVLNLQEGSSHSFNAFSAPFQRLVESPVQI
jgi:hypothetical protein